jgi:hypothetical protein
MEIQILKYTAMRNGNGIFGKPTGIRSNALEDNFSW